LMSLTWPAGWEALARWGVGAARVEPLAGGVANDVWGVRVYGRLAVGRLGARGDADLAWEAAVCWDDEHAVRRLAEVRAV
jgi:hypothetical protein